MYKYDFGKIWTKWASIGDHAVTRTFDNTKCFSKRGQILIRDLGCFFKLQLFPHCPRVSELWGAKSRKLYFKWASQIFLHSEA